MKAGVVLKAGETVYRQFLIWMRVQEERRGAAPSYASVLVTDIRLLWTFSTGRMESAGGGSGSGAGGEGEEAYHEASTQPGSQVDKHLMALLVKAQKQDEDNFDDMSDDAYDGDIRGFAAKFHGPVEEQLDAAKAAADVADKLP